MKRKWMLILCAIGLQSFLWAQQLPRQVLSSAGNNSLSAGISLSWTAGQPGPVSSSPLSSFYITQGYQQGDEFWVSVNGKEVTYTKIKVYPNPSSGVFHLEGVLPGGGVCCYRIIDESGKQMVRDYFIADAAGNLNASLDLSKSPVGAYYLTLNGGEGIHTYTCSCKLILIK